MLFITPNSNLATITIYNGVDYIDAPIGEISVFSQGVYCSIYWSPTQYVSDLYTNFTVNGSTYGSADAVENAIAALLVLSGGGGGSVGGTGASPQVAYWTATSTIAGSNNFRYNADGNNEIDVQKIKMAVTTLTGSPQNGYFEYDGSILYFVIGATRYEVGLT